MTNTGKPEYDSLPPKIGSADIEELKYLYVKHKVALTSVTAKLDDMVMNKAKIMELFTK